MAARSDYQTYQITNTGRHRHCRSFIWRRGRGPNFQYRRPSRMSVSPGRPSPQHPPYNTQDWRLVPPLVVGQGAVSESVAVFFRGTTGVVTRYFTGPNWFTGGYKGQSVAPRGGIPVNYPNAFGQPDFLSMLAPGGMVRNTPANALHNINIPETQLAARINFKSIAVPPAAVPPAQVNFLHYRQPYMVTFTETGGVPNPRHITLFACHAPPNNLPPILATTQFMNNKLPTMADIANPPAPNETKVICGDFNLNLLNHDGTDANHYAGLTGLGYIRMLAPPAGPPPPALEAYAGYFCTHIKRAQPTQNSRFLWSAPGEPSPYPGYGYLGSTFGNYCSIDNVLVRPAPGAGTLTVVNSVVGTPLNAVHPSPGGAPIGIDNFGNDMNNIAGWPESPNAAAFNVGMATNRKGWLNYGHIRNTSDYFALMAQI